MTIPYSIHVIPVSHCQPSINVRCVIYAPRAEGLHQWTCRQRVSTFANRVPPYNDSMLVGSRLRLTWRSHLADEHLNRPSDYTALRADLGLTSYREYRWIAFACWWFPGRREAAIDAYTGESRIRCCWCISTTTLRIRCRSLPGSPLDRKILLIEDRLSMSVVVACITSWRD